MMPTTPLIRCVFLTLLFGALPVCAQSRRLMQKLAEKPAEQILVFTVARAQLAKIIEATAWKMNYDSVLVNSAQNKILVFRGFSSSPLQYRILLSMTQLDSAVELASQGFWFLPPDSIPRYNKSMRSADRDLQKLFLCALTQEIALSRGESLFARALPEKTFSRFLLRNLLNPGLASWYIMKDHPRVAKKSAVGWSLFFGLLDVGYIALGFTTHREPDEGGAALINLSNQQMGLWGAATSRLAMTVGYFVDRDYDELKKSGYYFPKITDINFDSKYTRHLRQPQQGEKP